MEDSRVEQIIREAVKAAREDQNRDVARIEGLVNKMQDTLYGNGNGRPGLTATVDRLERTVGAVTGIWAKVVTALLTAAAVGVIVLLVQHGLITP